MKKILFTANTDRHILLCHMPYIKMLYEKGYRVDVATNTDKNIDYVYNKINLSLKRKPFKLNNLKEIFKLKKILKENNYDLIHTHTPVGSVITRIALKLSKTNTKLIYTCHGFHFYKGAPIIYWVLYYPIEKYLMRYTDLLLVMNEEDYNFSKKHFKKTDIRFINGVGFNKERLDKKVNTIDVYKELDIKKDSFIVTYVAEYSKRKRQLELIKELNKTNIRNTNIVFILIGDDILKGKVEKKIKKYDLENNIKTVKFTNEITRYLKISDVVISCSKQEGLPLNIMEAIYMKKIVVATNCRGNIDLIKENENGFIVSKIKDIYNKILYIKENKIEYKQGIEIEKYTSEYITKEVEKIYDELL